jgi:hypothetical protein
LRADLYTLPGSRRVLSYMYTMTEGAKTTISASTPTRIHLRRTLYNLMIAQLALNYIEPTFRSGLLLLDEIEKQGLPIQPPRMP